MKGKKGIDFSSAPQMVIILFIVIIMLATFGSVFMSMQETLRESVAGASTGVTLANNTAVALTHKDIVRGSTACVNATAGNTIGAGNYTITTGPGTITLVESTAVWDGEDVNCTYNRYDHSEEYNITEEGMTGALNLSSLIPTIAVMLAIVIVLLLIFVVWQPKQGMEV